MALHRGQARERVVLNLSILADQAGAVAAAPAPSQALNESEVIGAALSPEGNLPFDGVMNLASRESLLRR